MTMRLGLTGGIGSGKSTVAGILQRLGAPVVDADAISRATTAAGGAAIAPIREAWGAAMLTPEGALNRDAMRERVFADPGAKLTLEAIIHPLVAQEIERQTQLHKSAQTACIVYDIPLLVESRRWRKVVDRVLVVDCSASTQVARVVARSGLEPQAVQAIIAAQASRERRLAAADAVIFNDALEISALEQQVQDLAKNFGL